MKKFAYFFLLALFCWGCKAERLTVENAKTKEELFLTGQTGGKGKKYSASEAEHPDYFPTYLHEGNGLSFRNRNYEWQVGAEAINDYLNDLLETQSHQPDLPTRVDMQFISYIGLDNFIFKGEAGKQQSELAAQYLNRLFTHTEPWEWRLLAETLLIAKAVLPETRYQEMHDYILSGAKSMLKKPKRFTNDQSAIDHLSVEAEIAIRLLE